MKTKNMIRILASVFCFSLLAIAETKATEILRWGADSESGAPYAFSDPADPTRLIGFEVDIVNALAKEMGMKPQHVQNQWDGLVQGLLRKDYDIVVNGLEITDDRKEVVHFSLPYYVTSEVLTVRKKTFDINSLDDLKNKKVGTLDGALAQRILEEAPSKPEIKLYDEEVLAYNDLAMGRLDAVLLDEPIAVYYASPNDEIKNVGGAIGRMEYGIAIRKGDEELLNRVNKALTKLIEDGTMKEILERWSLWNQLTAKAWGQDPGIRTAPIAYEQYMEATGQAKTWKDKLTKYFGFLPLLGKGAALTLGISVAAMLLAIVLGLLTAVSRLYGNRLMQWLAITYVEIFRGTPLLIQLYLIFYGLPHLGIRLDPFLAAVLGLGLNYGACEAENYRAGIQSIPKSQDDAAHALGMTRGQSLRFVVMPQAMRIVIPPVTNDFIALLKDSSLVSVITMVELTTIYGQLASTYFDYLGIGLITAAVYFLIGLPFVRLSRWTESKLITDKKPRLA